jgi:hypothetical protein
MASFTPSMSFVSRMAVGNCSDSNRMTDRASVPCMSAKRFSWADSPRHFAACYHQDRLPAAREPGTPAEVFNRPDDSRLPGRRSGRVCRALR